MNSFSDGFNPGTPTPKGYEKAFEKGRDGDGVVITENVDVFSWLDGFNIPVILGSKAWDQSTAMMVEGWRLVFTPFDNRKFRHAIAKAVDGVASTDVIKDIQERTIAEFIEGGGNADIFEDYLCRAHYYEYREEIERKKNHGWNWSGLMGETFPELKWIVPGVLPEGLNLLSGAPKIGKSWFALDLAASVALGRPFLGDLKPITGDVLYWALEDSPGRLQRRLGDIIGDSKPNNKLIIRTAENMPPQLDQGGLELIENWYEDADNPVLVIIDVLEKVRPDKKGNESEYSALYKGLKDIHSFTLQAGLSTLVIHHNRKGAHSLDPFEDVAGSMALTSLPDATLVLRRDTSGYADAIIYGRGRDLDEFETAIEFENQRWVKLGDAATVKRSDQRNEILQCLGDFGEPMKPKAIADKLGQPANNISRLLNKMVLASEVKKAGYGLYEIRKGE